LIPNQEIRDTMPPLVSKLDMSKICTLLAFCIVASTPLAMAQAPAQSAAQPARIDPSAWQLLQMANASRNKQGIGPLTWDPALAKAAFDHCQRMIAEGHIAHRYGDELNVDARAAQAGAHFSLIEENIAIGSTPAAIHQEWMNSPEHRDNLLNPQVNRVGVAVLPGRGILYAVADYAHTVPVLKPEEVEARIGSLIVGYGLTILADPGEARTACAADHGMPPGTGPQPMFVMRWQGADLSVLPQSLVNRLKTGQFKRASVGSCPTGQVEGGFTAYRVAVLLYGN
jgi:hypothetical protein